MGRLIFIICILIFSGQAYGAKGRLVIGSWQQSWNDTLKDSIKSSGLLNHQDDEIIKICPKYRTNAKTKMIFWQQLMISLAWEESRHGPRNYVYFNGGINKGLYQINPKLRTAYGCRGYDLYSPIKNIQCGVKMAKKLVTKYGSFLTGKKSGMAAYWQPLRSTSKANRADRAKILAEVQSACQNRHIAYLSTGAALVAANLDDIYEQYNLSFNIMDGPDINLQDEEIDIETGFDEELDYNITIDEGDDVIEV